MNQAERNRIKRQKETPEEKVQRLEQRKAYRRECLERQKRKDAWLDSEVKNLIQKKED